MRNNKKWLVLLLAFVMLVSNLGISAAAVEDESPITLHAAATGSTVQVQIMATEAQTVADGKLVLTYDAALVTYVDTVAGSAWTNPDKVTLSVGSKTGKVILAFANADAAADGVLFTLTFQASADAVIALDDSSYITGVKANLAQEVSTCLSAQFADVAYLSPEAHDAVDYMVGSAYMNGISTAHFAPYLDLNRAMMVTILYRIAGSPDVSGTHNFVDVADGRYYTEPVIWAVENGITHGLDSTHFAPDKSLTRQELVTFLYRFAGFMGYDRTATADLSTYTDVAKIGSYAADAFSWAVAEGVIKGTTATTLDPEATTTRAQVSLMVYRLLSKQN